MSRRMLWSVCLVCAAVLISLGLTELYVQHSEAVEKQERVTRPEANGLRELSQRLVSLHEMKRPPKEGDWLAKHTELGQTFNQYLIGRQKPVWQEYATLYIQPIGEFTELQQQILDSNAEFMKHFLGMPVKTLPKISLAEIPPAARRIHPVGGQEQILTTHVLNKVLKPILPDDAAAVLGITATDLWPGEGWNFVFGQASLSDRVGVWSISRNGDPAESKEAYLQCLRRTTKVAVHETGHMLAIQHCIAYECCMNGANSNDESDRQPMEFCPECQPKIWWTCNVDPAKRCRALAAWADANGLQKECLFWRAELERLEAKEK